MFFSQAEKNQKAWALGEKPTADLCRMGRGAAGLAALNQGSAELAALKHRLPPPAPFCDPPAFSQAPAIRIRPSHPYNEALHPNIHHPSNHPNPLHLYP